jgi:hypothetical protein
VGLIDNNSLLYQDDNFNICAVTSNVTRPFKIARFSLFLFIMFVVNSVLLGVLFASAVRINADSYYLKFCLLKSFLMFQIVC